MLLWWKGIAYKEWNILDTTVLCLKVACCPDQPCFISQWWSYLTRSLKNILTLCNHRWCSLLASTRFTALFSSNKMRSCCPPSAWIHVNAAWVDLLRKTSLPHQVCVDLDQIWLNSGGNKSKQTHNCHHIFIQILLTLIAAQIFVTSPFPSGPSEDYSNGFSGPLKGSSIIFYPVECVYKAFCGSRGCHRWCHPVATLHCG